MIRNIIGVIALLFLLVLLGFTATTTKQRPSDAEVFALRVHNALKSMEVPKFSAKDATWWVAEFTPYFGYEGVDRVAEMLGAGTDQVEVEFILQEDGGSHNHILGYTYCEGVVVLNGRMISPVSTWKNRPDFLATLVHEAVHNIGGAYCSNNSKMTESRTQLGTLEVLAAMANAGNRVALYTLLNELQDIAENVVWYNDLKNNDMKHFLAFQEEINDGDAMKMARLEKALRYWHNDLDTLKGILDRYSVTVWEDFIKDFKYVSSSPMTGDFIVNMDDLRYVINHMEEMCLASPE